MPDQTTAPAANAPAVGVATAAAVKPGHDTAPAANEPAAGVTTTDPVDPVHVTPDAAPSLMTTDTEACDEPGSFSPVSKSATAPVPAL